MSMSNIGPEHADSSGPGAVDSSRRGNPLLYRDEPFADEVFAASTRATTVTHRFGGVRHALSRPAGTFRRPPAEEDESDARD